MAQAGPEALVLGRRGVGRIAERAMVAAEHLVAGVAHDGEEVVVGVQHLALEVELDPRHRAVDGAEDGVVLGALEHARGDVGGELDHAHHLAIGAEHRVVGRLQPHRVALRVLAQEAPGHRLAAAQAAPVRGVFGRVGHGVGAEQAMVVPDHLLAAVLHRGEEEVVGEGDGAVGREFDARGRAVDGVDDRLLRSELCSLFAEGVLEFGVEHVQDRGSVRWKRAAARGRP